MTLVFMFKKNIILKVCQDLLNDRDVYQLVCRVPRPFQGGKGTAFNSFICLRVSPDIVVWNYGTVLLIRTLLLRII